MTSVMTSLMTSLLLVMTSHVHVTSGFSRGAPQYACKNLTPGHSGAPLKQTEVPAPFSLTLSDGVVVPGGAVDVTVAATGADQFKGFLCVANDASDVTVQRGAMAAKGDLAQPVFCDKSQADVPYGMTHKSSAGKTTVTFSWTAPQDANLGDEYFIRCVVAQNFSRYWNDFESAVMIVHTGGMMGGGPDPGTSGASGSKNSTGNNNNNNMNNNNNNAGISGATEKPSNSASVSDAVSGSQIETGSGSSQGGVSPGNFRNPNDINNAINSPVVRTTSFNRDGIETERKKALASIQSVVKSLDTSTSKPAEQSSQSTFQSTPRLPLPVLTVTNTQSNHIIPNNAPLRRVSLPGSGLDSSNNVNHNLDSSSNRGQLNNANEGEDISLFLENPESRRSRNRNSHANRNRNTNSRLRWFHRSPGRVGGRRGSRQQNSNINSASSISSSSNSNNINDNTIRVARVTNNNGNRQQQRQPFPNTINSVSNLVQEPPSAFSSRQSHLISLIMRSSRVRPSTLNRHFFSE